MLRFMWRLFARAGGSIGGGIPEIGFAFEQFGAHFLDGGVSTERSVAWVMRILVGIVVLVL